MSLRTDSYASPRSGKWVVAAKDNKKTSTISVVLVEEVLRQMFVGGDSYTG